MLISVQLFVQGDRLQPKEITQVLGVEPSTAHALGDQWTSPQGKVYMKKVGLWKWGVVEDSATVALSEVASRFCRQLEHVVPYVARLPDADRVWIDVFVCHEPAQKESGEIRFSLSPSALRSLAAFNVPIEFSANLILGAEPSEGR